MDKFGSSDFYVIVKKGNTELLNEINYAIDQMNAVEGDWKTTLYNKNYESIETKNLEYTEQEKSIIAQYSKDNPLHVLCDPSRYPYSYNENGEMKGIIPDYFRKIADYAGISYEFLTPATRDEYIAYQKNKDITDISIDAVKFIHDTLIVCFSQRTSSNSINISTLKSFLHLCCRIKIKWIICKSFVACKTPEREEKFDFSRPKGTNNGILTVRSDNSTIVDGNYSTYNGMRVAFLNGSSEIKSFADFAGNKGFTYDPFYFDTTAEMEEALQSGNVDAIAASSLRKTNNELIVDKFDSSDFYVMVPVVSLFTNACAM